MFSNEWDVKISIFCLFDKVASILAVCDIDSNENVLLSIKNNNKEPKLSTGTLWYAHTNFLVSKQLHMNQYFSQVYLFCSPANSYLVSVDAVLIKEITWATLIVNQGPKAHFQCFVFWLRFGLTFWMNFRYSKWLLYDDY